MATIAQKAFIITLGEPAKKEFAKSNIFPSLVIAQGILESGWGKSELAISSNNLFGRRGTYKGESVQGGDKDISKDGKETAVVVPFRKYPSIAESIQDHIDSLLASETTVNKKVVKRYQRVIDAKTYQEGAQALYDCGYAGDKNYPSKLVEIIDKYKLHEWDVKEVVKPEKEVVYHVVKSGDSVSVLAKKYSTTIDYIKKLNNLNDKYTIFVGQRLQVS